MNVATGVFRSVDEARDAYRALQKANFDEDTIGLVVCDREMGKRLSSDLHRDFHVDETPDQAVGGAVYCKFSDQYQDTIRMSNLPEDALDWYRGHLNRGHILLIVQVGDRMSDADRIIHEHGGILYQEQFGQERMTQPRRETREVETTGGVIYVPIVEEEVMLEKTAHQVGEVEVSSETTSQQVEMPATVMHEEIRVERRTLDRPMSVDEYREKVQTSSGTVRMPVVEEELRVMKKPVIREEMIITRVPVSESKTIREQVQRTEPHVETEGEVHIEKRDVQEKKRRPAA
ncbi:MAG: YsnF/AvaK domain-containing protein [Armatimonadota bacterium]